MTRKLLPAALCVAVALVAAPAANAQTEAVDEIVRIAQGVPGHVISQVDPFCKVNYVTGEECQAPDADASASGCSITSWVGSATCRVDIPDGAGALRVSYGTRSELDQEPSFELVVSDASGTVVHSHSGSGGNVAGLGSEIGQPLVPLWKTNGFSSGNGPLPDGVAGPLTCEITGTHAMAGAVHPSAHNVFGCDVL